MNIEDIEKFVDSGLPKASTPHTQSRKHNRKTLKMAGAILVACCFIAPIAYGAYITYFAEFEKELTVTQSITVDGNDWDEPFTYAGTISAGCCEIEGPYTVTNNACDEGMWLDFVTTETSAQSLDGINVNILACPQPHNEYLPQTILLRQEDWQGNWAPIPDGDHGQIIVNHDLTFDFDASGLDDGLYYLVSWQESGMSVIEIASGTSDDGVISIDGTLPVLNYITYTSGEYAGQTGAKIWLIPESVYDGVNHVITAWTPTSWLFENLLLSQTFQEELVPGGECTCDSPAMELPFYLEPGESLQFCVQYKADMMLEPNVYNIQTLLVPTDAPQV
jgi:hypothetical protein